MEPALGCIPVSSEVEPQNTQTMHERWVLHSRYRGRGRLDAHDQ